MHEVNHLRPLWVHYDALMNFIALKVSNDDKVVICCNYMISHAIT